MREYLGTVKAEKSPEIPRDVQVAMTEAMMIGLKEKIPNSPRMTSTAKRAPAIGALKVAPIPAPAPAATRVRIPLTLILNNCPIEEARLALIWTIGPSRPVDPPEPIQIDEARALTTETRFLIFPARRIRDSMISGTPCPLASLAP